MFFLRGLFFGLLLLIALGLLFISAATLKVGTNFVHDKSNPYGVNGLDQVKTCVLDDVAIIECRSSTSSDNSTSSSSSLSTWVTVWRDLDTGLSVLWSPLVVMHLTREQALAQQHLFNNVTAYPCLCNKDVHMPFPSVTCGNPSDVTATTSCVLDVTTTTALRNINGVIKYGSDTLLGTGVVLTVIAVGMLFLMVMICVTSNAYFRHQNEFQVPLSSSIKDDDFEVVEAGEENERKRNKISKDLDEMKKK